MDVSGKMQRISQFVRTRRAAGLVCGAAICGAVSAGADATLPPAGMYIWYDQPVWCAVDWASPNPCLSDGIYNWNGNYLCDLSKNAYESVVQMATNTLPTAEVPQAAQIFGGTVFMIAETLTPDGAEFKPWSSFEAADVPECYRSNSDPAGAMMQDVYHAHAAFISGMKDSSGAHRPVGLMFSNARTLRWGRWLAPHTDADGTHWGGRTQLNNTACGSVGAGCAAGAPAPCDCSDGGAGSWSLYWPDNATYSSIDDYDITINFAKRVRHFVQFAQTGIAAGDYDFGSSPVVDVYLDLEMFQLSKVAPSGSATDGFGVYYPGSENMPQACLDHIIDPSGPAWSTKVLNYWQVPASVADALWRTLRDVRTIVDTHNASVSDQDWQDGKGVRLSMSVWAQEAYRFVSPRFAVEDTMTRTSPSDDSSWNNNSDHTAAGYGMFNQPFGSAKMDTNGNGTAEAWQCDCCTLSGAAGGPDFTSTVIDDFSILNCIYKYADRVVFGTYQSVPAALDHIKKSSGVASLAVDFVGHPGAAAKPLKEWKPGDGIPLVGPTGGTGYQVDFTKAYTYDVARPYQYSAIGAWPPSAAATDATPDWSQFTDCTDYWGFYDTSTVRPGGVNIPTQGWVPFASRFLRGMHRWQAANPSSTRQPKAVFALEMTGLDTYNAGSSTACARNSYGNQWVWGNDSDPSAPCATDVLTENLCQADRVLYVVGTDSPNVTPTADSSIKITNAWGIRPAMRLWRTTPASDDGTGTAMLSDYLDTTAFAMNNYFSYHCLFSHTPYEGTFTSTAMCSSTHAANTPGWCNNPWGSCYGGCDIPGSHVRPSPVALFMRHDGLPGDVNNDRLIGVDDMLAIMAAWGVPCSGPCAVDHDGDGAADIDDLLGVLSHWSP
jgi:hypothetical protein